MKRRPFLILFIFLLIFNISGCNEVKQQTKDQDIDIKENQGSPSDTDKLNEEPVTPVSRKTDQEDKEANIINEEGMTIATRFLPPTGYKMSVEKESFASYLQNLPLKPHGAKVLYYNGKEKPNRDVYIGVVDMDIGSRDLQQCADAIMRLRGEYLYHSGQENKIHFNFTNGFTFSYSKWKDGYGVKVEGNKCSYIKNREASNSYENFRAYMNMVFAYAGTLSLEQELKAVAYEEMKVGHVFIQGGSPGHAVIVVNMAVDDQGNKVYMLAQSYMPAQETQILLNPGKKQSPWYDLKEVSDIITPEWTFKSKDLKAFVEE